MHTEITPLMVGSRYRLDASIGRYSCARLQHAYCVMDDTTRERQAASGQVCPLHHLEAIDNSLK
jgi:hypothetical protein